MILHLIALIQKMSNTKTDFKKCKLGIENKNSVLNTFQFQLSKQGPVSHKMVFS